MKFDCSVVWGVGIGIGDKVVRYIGGKVESDFVDKVGEVVEGEVRGKILMINMSKIKSNRRFMIV